MEIWYNNAFTSHWFYHEAGELCFQVIGCFNCLYWITDKRAKYTIFFMTWQAYMISIIIETHLEFSFR